jgi:hypothetical protein
VQQFTVRSAVAAQRPSHLKGLSHEIDVIFRTELSVCVLLPEKIHKKFACHGRYSADVSVTL